MRNIIAMLALLLVTACASDGHYEAQMNRWIGASERDLVTTWGVPDKTYQVDRDSKMLAYISNRNVNYPGTLSTCIGGFDRRFGYNNCIGGIPPSNEFYSCETTFMVVGGRVTRWGHKGSSCEAY